MKTDLRKAFLSNALANYFCIEEPDHDLFFEHSCVNSFLDNGNARVLLAALSNNNDILLWNEVQDVQKFKKAIAFMKLAPQPVTADNLSSLVTMASVQGSAAHNFYSSIECLYGPLLMKSEEKLMHQCPRLQVALSDLVSGLSACSKTANERDDQGQAVIFDLASEADYWLQKVRSGMHLRNADRMRCEAIYNALKPAVDITQRLSLQAVSVKPIPADVEEDIDSRNKVRQQFITASDAETFLSSLSRALETTVIDSLDDVWRLKDISGPYSEVRMRGLLEAIAGWLTRLLLSYLNPLQEQTNGMVASQIWSKPFKNAKLQLERGVQVCEQWEKSCLFFTQQLWARDSTHRWEGDPPKLTYLQHFKQRMSEVLGLRSTYEQLSRLLSAGARDQLGLREDMGEFLLQDHASCDSKDMSNVVAQLIGNPLAYNPYNSDQWYIAVNCVNDHLQVAEEAAVPHLRNILSAATLKSGQDFGSSRLMFLQFQRFVELIKRPTIAQSLHTERESFLGYIDAGIKELREEFGHRPEDQPSCSNQQQNPQNQEYVRQGKNIPAQVDRIIWAGQLEAKASEHLQLAEIMLHDLEGFSALKHEVVSLVADVSTWRREQFDNWCRASQSAIAGSSICSGADDDENLVFDATKCLLQLSTNDGRLQVGYPDGLLRLQREVRLLSGFGYPVPSRLHKVTAQAEIMYRHAIVLKQVAHFYNSIDSQMIPSQQALMLKSAMAFEHLVKFSNLVDSQKNKSPGLASGRGGITWQQAKEVPIFISQLQVAAKHLMEENRQLRKVHYELISKIISLMDVDLLRQQGKWREALMTMRCRLAEVASSGGYPVDHMTPWRAHLDRQLYKALEVQYRLGLEALTERMPEMRVELVYQQAQLTLQPPLEEIRSRYYKEMRKFVGIPCHFRGVGEFHDVKLGDSNMSLIFPLIIENQSAGFRVCYRKAEFLFSRLAASIDQFRDWVVLGNVNLDDLVDDQCRAISDYENNFRALKRRGRAAEELPNDIRIDCFTISCVPVKNTIEQLLQNLYESLLNCLRRSVQADLVAADAFLTDALEKLSLRPQTVEEMTVATAKHADLVKGQLRLASQLKCAEEKDKLLKNVAGSGISAFTITKCKWDKFQLMMESFKLMMNEQMDVLKANVYSRVNAFASKLEKFSSRWRQLRPSTELLHSGDREQCLAAVGLVRTRQQEFIEMEETMEVLKQDCVHFEIPPPDLTLAEELKGNLDELEVMWSVYEKFTLEMQKYTKEDWISFRSQVYLFEDFLTRWNEQLRSNSANLMTVRLMKEIDHYKELIPVLKWVRGEALSADHWIELFRLLGLPRGKRLEELTFGDIILVTPAIVAQAEALKNLSQRAQAEVIVREALQELDVWGAGAVFSCSPFTNCKGQRMNLIKDWKEIVTQVGDNQALLASLQGSPYFGSFADRANAWSQRLADLDACLIGLQAVQRRWVYLEPIFGGGALTREVERFNRVDSDFRSILSGIELDNRVVSFISGKRENELRNHLTSMQDQLTRCQRALSDYLEEKRNLFPRFYFIGDDDLLEILGQSTNPNIIQTHLRKLFQAVHKVNLSSSASSNEVKTNSKGGNYSILGICSADGETVNLGQPVVVVSEVEKWLEKLESEMRISLSSKLSECLVDKVDPSVYPGQILALREAIQFSEKVEIAISSGRLAHIYKELQNTLKTYAEANLKCRLSRPSKDEETGEGDISRVVSAKLITLILDTGHNIDVLSYLMKERTASVLDWAWQKQLRFYASREPSSSSPGGDGISLKLATLPFVRMVDAEFAYTFEYQGNASRLVHTPLTDKCYLTLTQAMRMGLGGNPYGPAGTGKTESVKQLGGLLARQVLVFNCDEGIDVQSMGRIFVGLVKCGAWGCFDEFNRLEEAVLSAVSMQIQVIQNGLRSGSNHVELLGNRVSLSPNSGIFITMNPAGKGYGGRKKLPDNLKQLFRPVAMTKPDDELIAETILFSQGFTHGRILGKKLVAVFSLSSQLLSEQQHYDWGLRALKTVLRNAGTLLSQTPQPSASDTSSTAKGGGDDGLAMETRLVVQAVRSASIAKLTYSDATRFNALLHDVFPNPSHHETEDKDDFTKKLLDAMHQILSENQLVLVEKQIQKALEVYSQLCQRMGVVVVGPSGCGKSTVLRILWLALQKLDIHVSRHQFNPKAMPRAHLLGHTDPDTREWTDGVLTRSAREVVRESAVDKKSWIVCDGDIDPEWVESLNSVLDDNRLLTLPSGERIQFGANINFLFETHELTCASPATVSRMGVIFISDETLDAKALVQAWLQRQPEEERQPLSDMLETAFYTCLDWVRKKNEYLIETSSAGTIFNGLSHLIGATTRARFTVGLIRGLGSNLPEPTKVLLANQIYQIMGENPPEASHPLNVQVDPEFETRLIAYPHGIKLAHLDNVSAQDYDLFATTTSSSMSDSVNSIGSAGSKMLSSLKPPLVVTPHVRRAVDSFRCWLDDPRAQQSFLLVGPEGSGKSQLLEFCLAASKRVAQVAVVQCAAQTRPSHVLDKLMQYCITVTSSSPSSNASRILRPKEGNRIVLFLRDLNLPKPDKWGSCQLTAFLQQILTYNCFYDASSLEFIGVEGIQIVGTLTPNSASGSIIGRYPLTTRLTSVLRVASITSPDREELDNIYQCLLQLVASEMRQPSLSTDLAKTKKIEDRSRLHALASTMVHAWFQLEQTFRANKYPHCAFSLRDLTRWVIGLLRYDTIFSTLSSGAEIWLAFGYEARRLFRDRLPGEEHRIQFDRLFSGLLHGSADSGDDLNEWNSQPTISRTLNEISIAVKFATGDPICVKFEDYNPAESSEITLQTLQTGQYWFATWGSKEVIVPGSQLPERGRSLGLISYTDLHYLASCGLKQLARESSVRASEIVLFPDYLDLLTRIDRVLARPAGSLLLAGRCGIGRRSALRLVAHLHQLPLFTLRVGQHYSTRNFINDLKVACQSAGIEAVSTVLLVEDHHLVHDTFLEIINSLLACGEAPGLISAEDLDVMAMSAVNGTNLREAAADAGHQGTLMSFFAHRVHANLHVVVVLDIDDGESLVARLQANPSLYKHCEVHWLDKWSKHSQFLLPRLLVPLLPGNVPKDNFARACLSIHANVPYPCLASPRRFMVLCSTYQKLETNHRVKLDSQINRLRTGLMKLEEAGQLVSQLKLSATDQGKLLSEKQAEADKALTEISAAMQGAGKQRAEMEELQKRSTLEAANLAKRKQAIDCELTEIGPILREAQSAVSSIRGDALSEMRALRAPPDVIRDILEGVLLLMGVRDTSWVSMRNFLARRGIQEEIRNFDARRISSELRRSVENLLKKNANSFNPKAAKRASVAAAPLAAWVQANVQFSSVLERISPLEKEQAYLMQSLEETQSEMKRLAEDLGKVDSRVAALRATFESHTKAAANLRIELVKAKNTLSVAENLVGELDGEHTRWNRQVTQLSDTLETLPATALISAGFVTYLSPCSEDLRQTCVSKWWTQLESVGLKIPSQTSQSDVGFDLRRFLANEREQLQWKSQGLPSDQLSGENAVVILQSRLCPFIVDPSQRAIGWLKTHLKDQRIEVIDQQSSNFVTTLELAVRFGKVLVIQEVDQIEPILFPLLKRDLSLQGPRATVKLGEKEVDYNEEFRLFMTTRQPSIKVGVVKPSSASSLVTVVNFQTTRAGLEGQLLEISLQHERAELETRRLELLKGEEGTKLELAQLEDQLLEELANARGNILENTDLLESLNKTKTSSIAAAQSLTEFERLQAELEIERKEFHHLAEGGSRVFFGMKDLVKINKMYQFSLNTFLNLFRRALKCPQETSLKINQKLNCILKRLETLVVEHVSRALFKSDRLMFVMHMTHCLRPEGISDDEWNFFINGPTSNCQIDTERLPNWVPVDRTIAMYNLKAGQPSLYEKLYFNNGEVWSQWMNSRDAEEARLPAALCDLPLSRLQILLVIQTLRPAELMRAMKHFVKTSLDLPHLSAASTSLQRLYQTETRASEPILIIISPGADPSQELAEAAAATSAQIVGKEAAGCSGYREVAMGQGQADLALNEITQAATMGGWVCLKNLHLVTCWLPVLEKHINSILNSHSTKNTATGSTNSSPEPHENFRLWLTTEPHDDFPSTLLQFCLKVAYEAPPGLRKNLKRTYESWNAEYMAKGDSINRSSALAGLAWFHAVIQERRGFLPQGWTKFYEFAFVDIRAAANIFDRLFLSASPGSIISSNIWASIKGLLNNAIYGGRMDNIFDVRILETFLNQIFNDAVIRNRQLGSFILPSTTNIRDYVIAIDKLPDVDSPADLGLPANIGKTAQRAAALSVLVKLRTLQRISGSSTHFDRAVWAKELGPILILWKKLNQDGSLLPNKDNLVKNMLSRLEEKSRQDPNEAPILSFLHREFSNALGLIACIHSHLGAIAKLLRGTQVLTRNIDMVIQALLKGETPTTWLDKWATGPEEFASFLSQLLEKGAALKKWVIHTESAVRFFSSAMTYNLADLLSPDIFLNAVRQQTARKLHIAIDDLKLISKWPPSSETQSSSYASIPHSLRIINLQVEGAMFADGRLVDCQIASDTTQCLPEIVLAWTLKTDADPLCLEESIALPLYFDARRSSFFTQLSAPCTPGSQHKWIQNGTALFLRTH